MKFKLFALIFVMILFYVSWTANTSEEINYDDICFERDVLPIFQNNCALSGCHNSESRKEGLILDTYENILSGKKGRAIIPYDLKRSKVYKKITEDTHEDRMPPPPNSALTGEEITIINRWIMSGALNSKCEDKSLMDDALKSETIVNNSDCDTLNLTYKDIQPVIEKNCYKCHSDNAPGELFNLENYSQVKEKGESGKLFGAINHLTGFKKMPAKAPKLEGCDLAKMNAWINGGMAE